MMSTNRQRGLDLVLIALIALLLVSVTRRWLRHHEVEWFQLILIPLWVLLWYRTRNRKE